MTDTNAVNLESHTGETGATWTKHASNSGQAAIRTNRCFFSTAGLYYASGTPATAEYDVTATIFCASNAQDVDICGRMATGAIDLYMARFLNGSGYQLYKAVGGTFTNLGTYSGDGTTLTNNSSHTIKLEIRNAAKTVYVDGTSRLTSADNVVTAAGKAGIRASNSVTTTTGYHIDSITAADPVTAAATHPMLRRPKQYVWNRSS
jgi:hypothetical protein